MQGSTKASPKREVHEAFEALAGSVHSPVFLTCEHASQRLPEGYTWHPKDQRLVGTHWAYDIGAAEIVYELSQALEAPAVLSRFSRLLVDPNRPQDDETLFRAVAEGAPVELNRDLTEAERERRLATWYRPFHQAIDSRLAPHRGPVVFSIHSFTPVYEGQQRSMEVGVLFDTEDELGEATTAALRAAGFVTAMNEPYSGKEGLIHSAKHHAGNHGKRALELEVRQDRAVVPAFRARLVETLAAFFRREFG